MTKIVACFYIAFQDSKWKYTGKWSGSYVVFYNLTSKYSSIYITFSWLQISTKSVQDSKRQNIDPPLDRTLKVTSQESMWPGWICFYHQWKIQPAKVCLLATIHLISIHKIYSVFPLRPEAHYNISSKRLCAQSSNTYNLYQVSMWKRLLKCSSSGRLKRQDIYHSYRQHAMVWLA